MRMKNLTLRAPGALNMALTVALAISMASAATADTPSAQRALWLRAVSISPDGKTVAFSYHGDLWTVPSTGGAATPITVNADYDTSPVWSPDGKQIAYSHWVGTNGGEIFTMNADGTNVKQLTNDLFVDMYPRWGR